MVWLLLCGVLWMVFHYLGLGCLCAGGLGFVCVLFGLLLFQILSGRVFGVACLGGVVVLLFVHRVMCCLMSSLGGVVLL